MKLYPQSLRQKILIGYVAGAILIFAFALLSWSNLSTQQEIVTKGETVSTLFDTTLEIRRFEKNYFLYRTTDDYKSLLGYISQADDLLDKPELELFATADTIDGLKNDLKAYGDLLAQDAAQNGGDPGLEAQIREKGKEIVTTGEQIANNRVDISHQSLTSAKRNLLIAIGMLLAAVIALGVIFSRKAVRPLSDLEKHMIGIAEGEFALIPTQFNDREFISLKAAFNRMLVELRERQDYLVESEKYAALGTLMFGVAHELNNPLANISTSCQIIREEIDEGDIAYQKELLDQIARETERARHIVDSILNYSRSRERTTFELLGAAEETMRLIRVEVPAGIEVRIEIPSGLTVFADRQEVQQMFINLIKNSIAAIEGEGLIRILASRHDDRNVEIVVNDNGFGMPPEQLEKIFNPFFTSRKEGYGLGLFIVHNIVVENGGAIAVDSLPGKGTTFTIVLPMQEPPKPKEPEK